MSSFLGSGWAFPVRPAGTVADPEIATGAYGIAPSAHEASIRESMWLILATARGERLMRPDFGCGIHDLVFAVNSATTMGTAMHEVRSALVRWEPRIEILGVSAAPDPAEPVRILIRIDYRVRSTNSQFNLVYPFYLERKTS